MAGVRNAISSALGSGLVLVLVLGVASAQSTAPPARPAAPQPGNSPQDLARAMMASNPMLQAMLSGPPPDVSRAIAAEQGAIARAAALPVTSKEAENIQQEICERVARSTKRSASDSAVYFNVLQAIQAVRVAAAYAPGGAVANSLPPQFRAAMDGSLTKTFTDMGKIDELLKAGQVDQVVASLRKNFEVSEGLMAPVFAVGGAPKSESLLKSLDFQVDLALSVAQRAPDNADAVKLAFVLMSVRKAKRLELERRTSAGLRDAPAANASKLRAVWLAQRSAIAALEFQRAMGVKPSDAERSKLQELSAAESQMQLQLTGNAKASRIADAGTDLDGFPTQLRARLAPGESVVSYVRYQAGVPGQKAGSPQSGPRYAAFLVNAQGLSFFDLGESAKIETSVNAYLTELDTLDACPQALATKKALASALYQAVFAPLSSKLAAKSAVRLVPDASLELVPFAALHDGSDWLLSRFQFSYAGSERELLGEYLPPRTPAPPLVLGWSPPNDNPPALVAGQPVSPNDLPALAGVTLEAQAVSQILPQSRLLSGANASEGSLFRAGSPSILHIAAHGVFVGGGATAGGARGLVLAPNATSKDCDKKRAATPAAAASSSGAADPNAPDPLVRSSLVLAPSGASSGDGFLTAYEVSTLDLWSTELAVLSACETGRGGLGRTEGVRGMRAAFSIAGARSLVVSLWHVPDSPTMNLMKEFYARLVKHEGRREALQQAMLTAQQLDPDPSSWAGFILLGDTGPLVALGGAPAQASGLAPLPAESNEARQSRAVNFINMEQGRAANPSTVGRWTFRGASDQQLAGDVRTGLGPARNNTRLNLLGQHTAIAFFILGYHGVGTYAVGARGNTAGFRLVSRPASEDVAAFDPAMGPVGAGTLIVTKDGGGARQGKFSLDVRGSKLEGTFDIAGY